MAIKWVDIDSFRGISHLKYEPKQINVLIGRNNSGKTSVLAAISAVVTGKFAFSDSYSDVFLHVNNEAALRVFDVKLGADRATLTSDAHHVVLYRSGTEIPDNLRMNYNLRVYSALAEIYKNLRLSQDHFDPVKEFIQTKMPVSVSTYDDEVIYCLDPQNMLQNDTGLAVEFRRILSCDKGDDDSKNQVVGTLLHQLRENINRNTLTESGKAIKIISSEYLFSKVFRDEVRIIELESILKEYAIIPNLERLTTHGVVYKDEQGELSSIPYSMHGDGFFTLLRLLYVIQEARDGILLIEEPENHMHPGYLRILVEQLVQFATKLNVQVFLTTHSSDLISEFAHYPVTDEEDSLIQITSLVHRDGETEQYNYSTVEARKTLDELLIDLRGT